MENSEFTHNPELTDNAETAIKIIFQQEIENAKTEEDYQHDVNRINDIDDELKDLLKQNPNIDINNVSLTLEEGHDIRYLILEGRHSGATRRAANDIFKILSSKD